LPLAYRSVPSYGETPARRRLSGFGLALGINLLVLLAFLTLGVRSLPQRPSGAIVVNLIPDANEAESDGQTQRPAPAKEQVQAKEPPRPLPPAPPRLPVTNDAPLPWIEISRADMIAGDIGRLPKRAAGAGDSEEVGRAPNGELLYAAEWARRPTNAELRGYIPPNAPDGWGMVACKTIPENRVDECIELGQSPLGSRLASAVRQAAWQFRVRPPRRNGRPMIGVWVRIRIDYETVRS
jgi:protein TonB